MIKIERNLIRFVSDVFATFAFVVSFKMAAVSLSNTVNIKLENRLKIKFFLHH